MSSLPDESLAQQVHKYWQQAEEEDPVLLLCYDSEHKLKAKQSIWKEAVTAGELAAAKVEGREIEIRGLVGVIQLASGAYLLVCLA